MNLTQCFSLFATGMSATVGGICLMDGNYIGASVMGGASALNAYFALRGSSQNEVVLENVQTLEGGPQ